jgi:hypothetical protein
MAGWLRVAIHAQIRDSAKQADWRCILSGDRRGRVSVRMALSAVYFDVLSRQRKAGCGMIKFGQPILAIMA